MNRRPPTWVALTGPHGQRRLICIGRDRHVVWQAALAMTEEPFRVESYGAAINAANVHKQPALAEQITRLRERVVTWQDIITREEG